MAVQEQVQAARRLVRTRVVARAQVQAVQPARAPEQVVQRARAPVQAQVQPVRPRVVAVARRSRTLRRR